MSMAQQIERSERRLARYKQATQHKAAIRRMIQAGCSLRDIRSRGYHVTQSLFEQLKGSDDAL